MSQSKLEVVADDGLSPIGAIEGSQLDRTHFREGSHARKAKRRAR